MKVEEGTLRASDSSDGGAVTKKRARAVGIVMILLLAICAGQLFFIQIVRGPALAEQGRQVRTAASVIPAPRGKIVDANDHVMVDSMQTYHVAVNQKNILEYRHLDDEGNLIGAGPAEAARLLAPLLDQDPATLGGEMLGDSSYAYIAKFVDSETFRKIRALGIRGIEWEPTFERVYPAGNAAASILGTVGTDVDNTSGLELLYNDVLEGTEGEESYEVSPSGAVIPGAKTVSKEAKEGGIVHTSLHLDLQSQVQAEVDATAHETKADWVSAVVLDVATSKVYVLADSGLHDPLDGPQMSNAVQSVFEPGSVGKIITMAAAIEAGKVEPTTPITVPYLYSTPDGGDITDLHEHETHVRTVSGVLTESSNTGTVQIGQMLDDKARFDMMKAFGLGEQTGIEVPGESEGILRSNDEWQGRDRYATMFGQGYAMTAVQQAAMMAAIGNGGVWQAPRLVDAVTYANGKYEETASSLPRQVVSKDTAKKLIRMMESVASDGENGTGVGAAVDGYRLAIKTGTAELPANSGTVATVAGVLPADNPQVAISIVVYNPKEGGYLSSDSAAPLFQKVAEASVRDLGIPASLERPELYPLTP
jgi:Cell division protein FtsI/penicillin-binding protein 2